jgi:histidine phosphotransferase ChpT
MHLQDTNTGLGIAPAKQLSTGNESPESVWPMLARVADAPGFFFTPIIDHLGAPMNQRVHPSDLELAALISSKICHDVINPVGAIHNGLEILDEDSDAESHKYALSMIRNVTAQASARLDFARYAYGAAGSAGAVIDLGMAERVSQGFVGNTKHKLVWRGQAGYMAKDKVKLLLNLVASAVTALPRGGEIEATIAGSVERPVFSMRCRGTGARPPQYLAEFVGSGQAPQLDAMTIQAYYACRLAATTDMSLEIIKDGVDVILVAKPLK